MSIIVVWSCFSRLCFCLKGFREFQGSRVFVEYGGCLEAISKTITLLVLICFSILFSFKLRLSVVFGQGGYRGDHS